MSSAEKLEQNQRNTKKWGHIMKLHWGYYCIFIAIILFFIQVFIAFNPAIDWSFTPIKIHNRPLYLMHNYVEMFGLFLLGVGISKTFPKRTRFLRAFVWLVLLFLALYAVYRAVELSTSVLFTSLGILLLAFPLPLGFYSHNFYYRLSKSRATRENVKWWLERNLILVILFLFLITGVPLILMVLVPSGLIAPDMGTDLTTEIIGIILTVFIIDRLLHWNEDRVWKRVKNQVYEVLGLEIYYIIIDLIYYIDLPTGLVTFGVGADEAIEEALRRNFFEKLDFVCRAESISMNDLFKGMVQKGGFGEIYSKREKHLSDIELKYSRFLFPNILIPLINIQKRLHSLDLRIRNRQKAIQRKWIVLLTEEQFYDAISRITLMIFKDICKLKESGLKVYFD